MTHALLLLWSWSMSAAVAEDGATVDLFPDVDNWAALQAFVDAHTSVLLPAGVWRLSRPLNVKGGVSLRGMGAEATTLLRDGAWDGPVVGMGGNGRWAGSAGYGTAGGVTLAGMTVWQTQDASANNKCIWQDDGPALLVENVRVRGSSYEGIVVGSLGCNGATIRNVEAWDCGNGGPAYTLSTAGINATSVDLLIEDFRTLRCGQGVETGNTRVTVRRGVVSTPGTGTPSLGVNVGSSVCGVYQTTVEDCVIDGYDVAVQVGNGDGRLAAVVIRRNTIYDYGAGAAAVGFQGGARNNVVPHADQGPDTEGSEITDNVLYVHSPHSGAIQYVSGINLADSVYGREPLTIARNVVNFTGGDLSLQTAPVFGFAGNISAACLLDANLITGLDASPVRGDVASFTLIDNPAVPGMPTLTLRGNLAYNLAGRSRPYLTRIEGA